MGPFDNSEPAGRIHPYAADWTDTQVVRRTGDKLQLPQNLTEWVPVGTLVQWIGEEVSALDWETHFLQFVQPPPEYRPRILLSILCFASCIGIFGASEIIACCHSEPAFQDLCEKKVPFPDELDHFRRANRTMLETVLYRVFLRLTRHHKGLGSEPLSPSVDDYLRCKAVERLDISRHVNTWDE